MNEGSSINNLIRHMQGLDDSQLAYSLRIYLKEGSFGDTPVYTILERNRFIAELFNRCDTTLQERIRRVFSDLLETFDGTNPKDDPEYLFYLASLASVIRCGQTKERLRRWIRQGTFDTWKYGIFNLNSELILATSSYDSDDEWVDFMLSVLPKRSSFKESALAAYRALWQSRGVECLSILPDVLLISDLEDVAFSQSLGYFLRLTIDKVNVETFCRTMIAVLDRTQRPVDEIWIIVLKIEEIVERELAIHKGDLSPLLEHLKVVWNRAVVTWQKLPPPYAYEAFDKLLEVPEKDWQNIRLTSPGIRGAFTFRKRHIIEVTEQDKDILERCEPFFEEISYEEEPLYLTAAAG